MTEKKEIKEHYFLISSGKSLYVPEKNIYRTEDENRFIGKLGEGEKLTVGPSDDCDIYSDGIKVEGSIRGETNGLVYEVNGNSPVPVFYVDPITRFNDYFPSKRVSMSGEPVEIDLGDTKLKNYPVLD